MNEFDSLVDSLPKVSANRNYWFVRTNGGDYYDLFKDYGFISVGWNLVTPSDIKNLAQGKVSRDDLYQKIQKEDPTEMRPGYVLNQVIDFVDNMKEGDVVIIPSESSELFCYGILQGHVKQAGAIANARFPFEKHRRVTWVKINVPYNHLDPYLFKIKYLQKTITHLDSEQTSNAIDRSIETFFVKGDRGHYVIRVESKQPVSTYELCSTMTELLDLTEQFLSHENVHFDKNEVDGKINIQSPGTWELISQSVGALAVIMILIGIFTGIEFQGEVLKSKLTIKTSSLLDKLTNWLNGSADREIKKQLKEKISKLDMNAEEIVNLLNALNGKEKNDSGSKKH